jgi:hypothetical protein
MLARGTLTTNAFVRHRQQQKPKPEGTFVFPDVDGRYIRDGITTVI